MHNLSFLALWEFLVQPELIAAFEKIYGPDGDWARLFRQSSDYRGTELIRDLKQRGRYLTLDHWASGEALQRFKQQHHDAYAKLDMDCESLTQREVFLGEFESVTLRTSP